MAGSTSSAPTISLIRQSTDTHWLEQPPMACHRSEPDAIDWMASKKAGRRVQESVPPSPNETPIDRDQAYADHPGAIDSQAARYSKFVRPSSRKRTHLLDLGVPRTE